MTDLDNVRDALRAAGLMFFETKLGFGVSSPAFTTAAGTEFVVHTEAMAGRHRVSGPKPDDMSVEDEMLATCLGISSEGSHLMSKQWVDAAVVPRACFEMLVLICRVGDMG